VRVALATSGDPGWPACDLARGATMRSACRRSSWTTAIRSSGRSGGNRVPALGD